MNIPEHKDAERLSGPSEDEQEAALFWWRGDSRHEDSGQVFLSSAYIVPIMGFDDLQKDERIILDEQKIAFRDKIILTNKRLVVLKPKGFLSPTFIKSYETPLSEILEAETDIDGFTMNIRMMLKMRDGGEKEFRYDPGAVATLSGATQMQTVNNAITEKWVNAINRAIDKKEYLQ